MEFLKDSLDAPLHFECSVEKKAFNVKCKTVKRGQTCESITIGKIPNRQIITYDKRAEAISKRTLAWFEIWGIDKTDTTNTVHRVELRAGKHHLKKNEITSLDDFRAKIKDVFTRDVRAIFYVKHAKNGSSLA